jgi:hypothetical protein
MVIAPRARTNRADQNHARGMRASGVCGLLVAAPTTGAHAVRIITDRRPDHIQLSELEVIVREPAADEALISGRGLGLGIIATTRECLSARYFVLMRETVWVRSGNMPMVGQLIRSGASEKRDLGHVSPAIDSRLKCARPPFGSSIC